MNEMSSPMVTVGMPVYNGERYIESALASLLAQTFQDFELIISDNASTDATADICEDYRNRDARIVYIRRDRNYGAADNFQFVRKKARGKYFMWAAVDDSWHRDFLELTTRVLEEDSDAGLVFCDMCTVNLETGEKKYSPSGYISGSNKFGKYFYRLFSPCPSLIYGLHRRSILDRIEIESFDFFDIYLTHIYELSSSIRTLPLVLYFAGSKGDRKPFSVTGEFIDSSFYLRRERKLLAEHFGPLRSWLLYALNFYLIKKNQVALNKMIREGG